MSDTAKVLEQLGGISVDEAKAPFLHNKVERLAARARIKKPQVYVIKDNAPNACAVGLSDADTAVAVTTGLLRELDESEIEAVLAHEIGHIQKGHTIAKTAVAAKAMGLAVAADFGGTLIQMSDLDFTPGDDDCNDMESVLIKMLFGALVQAAGAGVAAKMLQAISFDSEFEADACGGDLSRKPWALASALHRIESLAVGPQKKHELDASRLFIVSPDHLHHETHPPTAERIERLSAMEARAREVANVSTVFCSSCGDKTDSDGKYCYWCGVQLDTAEQSTSASA